MGPLEDVFNRNLFKYFAVICYRQSAITYMMFNYKRVYLSRL